MFKLFSALQTNYVKVRSCVFHCQKIQITKFLPSYTRCLTVLDNSLNCSYNSDRHARMHARVNAENTHTLLCVPFINNSLHPKTQETNYRFFPHSFAFLSFLCRCNGEIHWWIFQLCLNVGFLVAHKVI